MTTPMLPPLGSVYYETHSIHNIVVVTRNETSASKYGQVKFKCMDTGRDIVEDAPTCNNYYSPIETMEIKRDYNPKVSAPMERKTQTKS